MLCHVPEASDVTYIAGTKATTLQSDSSMGECSGLKRAIKCHRI